MYQSGRAGDEAKMRKSPAKSRRVGITAVGHALWKENVEDRVKLLESNILNCCQEITMANLRKIGLKIRE